MLDRATSDPLDWFKDVGRRFFHKNQKVKSPKGREHVAGMQWEEHENGYLAKTEHGFFFLYKESDLWYVEYDAGAEVYGDVESQPLNLRGFATVEEAKKSAEEYSKDLDEPLDLELPEEE
jgi:hypothetical protein